MKVVLELQGQPANIRRVTVRHDIVIGRGSDCNLRLSAPQISRRHCFLRVSRNAASVTDLDSSNGTFLAGERLTSGTKYNLTDGDELALGPVTFVVRVMSEESAELPEQQIRLSKSTENGFAAGSCVAERNRNGSRVGQTNPTIAGSAPMPDRGSTSDSVAAQHPLHAEDESTAEMKPERIVRGIHNRAESTPHRAANSPDVNGDPETTYQSGTENQSAGWPDPGLGENSDSGRARQQIRRRQPERPTDYDDANNIGLPDAVEPEDAVVILKAVDGPEAVDVIEPVDVIEAVVVDVVSDVEVLDGATRIDPTENRVVEILNEDFECEVIEEVIEIIEDDPIDDVEDAVIVVEDIEEVEVIEEDEVEVIDEVVEVVEVADDDSSAPIDEDGNWFGDAREPASGKDDEFDNFLRSLG